MSAQVHRNIHSGCHSGAASNVPRQKALWVHKDGGLSLRWRIGATWARPVQVSRRTQTSYNRRRLDAFYQGCWHFNDFRHNKGTIAALELMTKLKIEAYKTASDTQGRLRGALTSQEITKYVEYFLKPGKASGPDWCPNELLKTMSDENFLIVQAWMNEMLTLPENPIDTARHSRSTMNDAISQLHKGGSTNKTSDWRQVVQHNNEYQLLHHIINQRLKGSWNGQMCSNQSRAGAGRVEVSTSTCKKCILSRMKPTNKESGSIELTSTSETPSMQCRRQLSGTWWTYFIYQTLNHWSRFTTVQQSVWLQTTQKVHQSRLIQV